MDIEGVQIGKEEVEVKVSFFLQLIPYIRDLKNINKQANKKPLD